MVIKEITAKTILSDSRVYKYTVNPYIGCQHGCAYCYARYMKKYSGHGEAWGEFVDIKVNAPELLKKEITKKPKGRVWLSGVCDCYQPAEKRYQLTAKCLEILIKNGWPLTIQTKSPLVLRDIDLLGQGKGVEVGFSITTADDNIRRLFEPSVSSVNDRIAALEELHQSGIRTFAMIAPLLPGAEGLPGLLGGKVDYVLIDKMNYHHADWLYKKHGLEAGMSRDFFESKGRELASVFKQQGVECIVIY
jgi:DNA repair photolyase